MRQFFEEDYKSIHAKATKILKTITYETSNSLIKKIFSEPLCLF